MNLTVTIQTNDCPISLDPPKFATFLCFLEAEEICFEKVATDSTVFSGSLSHNSVCLKNVLASRASMNG